MYYDPSGYNEICNNNENKETEEVVSKSASIGSKDIEKYREELGNLLNKEGVPMDTVAVGKTDIPGLEERF